jgi:hypothetical protein
MPQGLIREEEKEEYKWEIKITPFLPNESKQII